MLNRDKMEADVLIVGAGPAGLATAIHLANLAKEKAQTLEIIVLEKGPAVGAHILSGAILEPQALSELIPNWQEKNAPVKTKVTQDQFLYLTKNKSFQLPTPKTMRNHGNYIISLGLLCKWLGEQAEQLGIQIFPGFAGSRILYENEKVIGIGTGDMGLDKNGEQSPRFQPGVDIAAKHVILAEGCRGSLTKEIIAKYELDKHSQPQSYGIGIKELWQVNNEYYQPGLVIHSVGWPLNQKTYGGSFLYHREDNKIAVGFVVGLDYDNPYLDPFCELQRFKTHPAMCEYFKNGKRIAYGARALVEGGYQSIPELMFPGGLIVGDAAGFVNVAKIKGIHNAIRSGMLAANFIFKDQSAARDLSDFTATIKNSTIGKELYQVRNIRPAFQWRLWPALIYNAFDSYLFNGKVSWTLTLKKTDYAHTKPAKECKKINYSKPDGKLTFDKLSSVYLTNVNHEENQPCHLQLNNPKLAIDVNYAIYKSPETRYCPAKVYEIVTTNGETKLQINAQNCIHCKTCDIKDPKQNINWVPPQGGEGPNYGEL